MFKQASKIKLRFATSKGYLSVEDLWDLSLPTLDKLAVSYDEELAKSPRKSFISDNAPKNKELELKFNIVKDIIATKLQEKVEKEAIKNKFIEKTETKVKKNIKDLIYMTVDQDKYEVEVEVSE